VPRSPDRARPPVPRPNVVIWAATALPAWLTSARLGREVAIGGSLGPGGLAPVDQGLDAVQDGVHAE